MLTSIPNTFACFSRVLFNPNLKIETSIHIDRTRQDKYTHYRLLTLYRATDLSRLRTQKSVKCLRMKDIRSFAISTNFFLSLIGEFDLHFISLQRPCRACPHRNL